MRGAGHDRPLGHGGAGSVVVRDVADFALAVGNPARQVGWVGRAGATLVRTREQVWECPVTGQRYHEDRGHLQEEPCR